MMRIRILIVGLLSLLLTSCYGIKTYEYLSLVSNEDIRVLAYATPELSGLTFAQDIPVSYELLKPNYRVYFDAHPKMYIDNTMTKHLNIRAENLDGIKLHLKGKKTIGSCIGLTHKSVYKPMFNETYNSMIGYWRQTDFCSDGTFDPNKQVMSFDVLDNNGDFLGQENVKIQLIKNGSKIYVDGM